MQKIKTVGDLKTVIQKLEYEQTNEWPVLKEQFLITVETLRPGNIIKGRFKEFFFGQDLKANLVNTAIGLTSGFVATKVLAGKVSNPLAKLILSAMVGMASANNASKTISGIKLIGSNIF